MILITGASGMAGGAVLAEVSRSGEKFRAMYRSKADAAKAPSGAEAVIADFADRASMASALHGVSSVYLVCAPTPELVQLESNAIDACVEAGVRRVVLSSALGAGEYGKSFPSWHRKVEDKLKATKLAWCIVQPNSFHQNVTSFYAPTIRTQGAFYASMGSAKVSFLDIRDIAAVCVQAFQGKHDGKTYELNGPDAITYPELAQRISKQTGVTAKYVDLPVEALRKGMLDQGMPAWWAGALLELQEYYTAGKGGVVDGILERLLGRHPITIDHFLQENAKEFRAQAAKA